MNKITFERGDEVFSMKNPQHYSNLYFPIANEQGIKSSITPNGGGDSKLDQNTFILEPVSCRDLYNNKSTRNFWINIGEKEYWSAIGNSAEAEFNKNTDQEDECTLEAGFMWQTLNRSSKKYGLSSEVINYVPLDHSVEIMYVKVKNTSNETKQITPTAAVPIYGRSADNIRDHRHVTSLLHNIKTTTYGVEVKPRLSFDERGHQKNEVTYFVYGITGNGKAPVSFFGAEEDFVGEGGSMLAPAAIKENRAGIAASSEIDGKEAIGGIKFETVSLAAGEEASYIVVIGGSEETPDMKAMMTQYENAKKVESELMRVKEYWHNKVNVSFKTDDKNVDSYLRWICFQPILRRIYGCSFLPHHDYGKGGRGWRDLWQDCLSLLFMDNKEVRDMIVTNYSGVRVDGTNATIIGSKRGEFKADRNSITRVWMDHGFWPFLTTKLYIDQTGDIKILDEQVPYFKDAQGKRGYEKDTLWNDAYGCQQKDAADKVYCGTVLEHILIQQLCAFYEVGEHNHIRLRNADWNDALDMAADKGESVAFTSAYAYNLDEISKVLEQYKELTGKDTISILKEMEALLVDDKAKYDDIAWKNEVLEKYATSCIHNVSGEKVEVKISDVINSLQNKAEWMGEHIKKNECVTDNQGNRWINGYYDNNGRQVEGVVDGNVRMMLTSQVFFIMSKIADGEIIKDICASADKYLYKKEAGGYRLNSKFSENKYDLGRMFGFAYGEKENGAVFSHMTVMYANSLYKKGYVKEGHRVLSSLLGAAMNFETSKIYPGIPEYFDAKGTGLYHYLTGAASWYMLTMINEVYGIKGEIGNLVIEPKLLAEQFDENGQASIEIEFLNKKFEIKFTNDKKLSYGEYKVTKCICDGTFVYEGNTGSAKIDKQFIEKLSDTKHVINVELA